jgi:hypothetical protein
MNFDPQANALLNLLGERKPVQYSTADQLQLLIEFATKLGLTGARDVLANKLAEPDNLCPKCNSQHWRSRAKIARFAYLPYGEIGRIKDRP